MPPTFSGPVFLTRGRVRFWEVRFSPGPVFPGKLCAPGCFPSSPGGSLGSSSRGPGRWCSLLWKTWSERSPAIPPVRRAPRAHLVHGSPGALEAAGVLRAAGQPGDAGGEGPCRGYPFPGVGARDARWVPGFCSQVLQGAQRGVVRLKVSPRRVAIGSFGMFPFFSF